jgi:hypothetical protein
MVLLEYVFFFIFNYLLRFIRSEQGKFDELSSLRRESSYLTIPSSDSLKNTSNQFPSFPPHHNDTNLNDSRLKYFDEKLESGEEGDRFSIESESLNVFGGASSETKTSCSRFF